MSPNLDLDALLINAYNCKTVAKVPSAFNGHEPFLHAVVRQFKIQTYVELGSFTGCSTLTVAEAMRQNESGKVFALDAWQGDIHMGKFSAGIFKKFRRNVKGYDNVVIKRGWFEDSLEDFEENSIDMILIDGQHDYKSVKQDFISWLPIVRPGGLVLFHDSAVTSKDFGVKQLITELRTEFEIFEFYHSSGLAVLQKSGDHSSIANNFTHTLNQTPAIQTLFQSASFTELWTKINKMDQKLKYGRIYLTFLRLKRSLTKRLHK